MRCTQWVGLNERAQVMLRHRLAVKTRSGEVTYGMFDEELPLLKFTASDGTVFYERVQSAKWHSGPVIFTALQDELGQWVPETLWLPEELDD